MQSSILTKPEMNETDTEERRRPGRFDDVNFELIPLLRGDAAAVPEGMLLEDNLPPGYASVSISARDPVAERETALKVLFIIVGLVGLVLLFGK